MFVKYTPTTGWTFNDPTAELVKVARRGLVGADRAALVKRAGAQAADWIDRLEPLPGEPLVHLIALGCTEKHSANRNGDGFKAAACRKYHDTFRKHARLYYNHLNTDPSKSYGVVKASWFNEPMGRIELVVGVNETKQAAQRNGGMVDFRFLPRVEKNAGDAAVSMACTIPFDVCSSCHNKAASRKYYCTGDTCPHGGCRDNLTKVSEDGHMLHVDNPDPKWFDISDVGTPADRIAYAFGRVGNTKSAAFDSGVAPSVLLPTWNTPGLDAHDRRRLVLAKLAALEDELLTTPPDAVDVGYARAADLARCPVTPDAWGRKHYPGNTVKWARLAGSAKTAFARLLAKPEVFEAPPETKYANSNPLAESDVIRQAAMAAITKVGAHRPLVGDPFADQLAWHQVAWAAAGRTADEVERRVEAVVRLNRAA